ncbi:MAG: regulatory protein RecX [Thermoclostridium sp.]|nr:regulatory protein RecX [Thermoclostridium sp.]
MVITSAIKQKNNPEMLRISIDGEYAFSIPEEEYYRQNLYEAKELTQLEIDAIREESAIKLAKMNGIRLLASKDRSEQEVRERLILKGFDADIAESAILQLKSMGYVNDSLFARKYVSDRLKLKPMSKKALAVELERKGIEKELICEVLDEYELDELSIAHRLAKKKYGKYDVNDPKIQHKVYSFLAYRGYSHNIVQEVLEIMKQ